MINGRRVVAIIPARGGSKTVPSKNLKELAGVPLVVWPIKTAQAVEQIDRVIVSTDDDNIARVAIDAGAEVYRRPDALARDDSLVIDAIRDLIARLGAEGETADVMVLLEPTSPLRDPADVLACLRLLADSDLDSVATFTAASLNPQRAWKIDGTEPVPFIDGANPWLPRQRLPEAYELNGSVYVFRVDELPGDSVGLLFGKTGAIVMSEERSIDIDTSLDFLVAEAMLGEKSRESRP